MKWPPKREGACSTHAPNSQKLRLPQSNSRSAIAQHVCAHSNTVTVREPPEGDAMSGETSRGGSALKTRPVEECSARKGITKRLRLFLSMADFNYRQIAREGDVAIYEQRSRDTENVCYEVVRIRRHEARTFPSGKSSPAREAYPTSAAWGVDGFTLIDQDAAYAKLRELRSRQISRLT